MTYTSPEMNPLEWSFDVYYPHRACRHRRRENSSGDCQEGPAYANQTRMTTQEILSRALRRHSLSLRHVALIHTSISRLISTMVLAEHKDKVVKLSSLSAVAAAGSLDSDNFVSILLGDSGPNLQKNALHAASRHHLISQVLIVDADIFLHPLDGNWGELIHLVQQKNTYLYIVTASSSFGKNGSCLNTSSEFVDNFFYHPAPQTLRNSSSTILFLWN